jgi:hypothetical protein
LHAAIEYLPADAKGSLIALGAIAKGIKPSSKHKRYGSRFLGKEDG